MKKVRVLKEMPRMKINSIWDVFDGYVNIRTVCEGIKVNELIRDGWLSWVEEEKTLEEKFAKNTEKVVAFNLGSKPEDLIHNLWKEHAQIAKEHYLAKFDEQSKKHCGCTGCTTCKKTRKALEDC